MNELCALSASEMFDRLARREISSVELVRAHLDRIEARDGALKAFTTVFRHQAIADAERADRAREKGEHHPLLGLPVSVKESVDMAGLAATMGVPSRRSIVAHDDGAMVKMLRARGAVILGRTNVSQYLLYHESRNPLFGQTANPFSLDHTSGGSSGGEATAIAAGMSPLGFGTDIGGSIRVPAHFTGIAGLKPTLDRWSNAGSNTSLAGQETIRGQIGPMARTVGDLVFAMKALDPIAMSALDPRVPPLPFDDPAAIDVGKVRVGFFVDDGWVKPSHAVARAIARAKEALEHAGVEVIAFALPHVQEAIELYFAALSADGGRIVGRGLEGGEVDPVLAALRRVASLPNTVRATIAKTLALLGESIPARLLAQVREKRVDELWGITAKVRAWRFEVLRAMEEAKIDAILSPAHATAALPHGMSKDFPIAGSGSMIFNLVQFPAGVVPVTRVRDGEARREGAKGRIEKHAAKVDERSARLPIGVQISTKPWREDLALALMGAIEREVKNDEGYPKTPV